MTPLSGAKAIMTTALSRAAVRGSCSRHNITLRKKIERPGYCDDVSKVAEVPSNGLVCPSRNNQGSILVMVWWPVATDNFQGPLELPTFGAIHQRMPRPPFQTE